MQSDADEYIAYRHDRYTHADADLSKFNEDEFDDERGFTNFKWNQFVHDYSSVATSDISFKRMKRDQETDTELSLPLPDDETIRRDGSDDEPPLPPEPPEPPPGEPSEGFKLYLTPIIGITAFFAIVFILGPCFVRKGPNRGIVKSSIMLSAFCMWIFWVTVYIGQMNPLMGPRLDNTTVAWLALKLGNPVKPPDGD